MIEMSRKMKSGNKVSYFKVIDETTSEWYGFSEIYEVNGPPLKPIVQNICVSPRARKHGIGRNLVRLCEEEAYVWGHSSIFLTGDRIK